MPSQKNGPRESAVQQATGTEGCREDNHGQVGRGSLLRLEEGETALELRRSPHAGREEVERKSSQVQAVQKSTDEGDVVALVRAPLDEAADSV
eukprot:SAG11_NODE_6961_length_1220_cov_2.439678_1_plen_93_part_00